MKKNLLVTLIFCMTAFTLSAQINYIDYESGWVIADGANEPVDIDQDGIPDFYINSIAGEYGFFPVFAVGCFTSPAPSTYNNINSLTLQIHEEGEFVQINGDNLYDYIDDDRGLIYKDGAGLADGWAVNEYQYIGFAVFGQNQEVYDGWMKVKFNGQSKSIVIKELAFTSPAFGMPGIGIQVGDKGLTDTRNIEESWLSVFPNPSANIVNIDFASIDAKIIGGKIYDAAGRAVRSLSEDQLSNDVLQLNVSNWPVGNYNLLLRTEEKIQSVNFVVE